MPSKRIITVKEALEGVPEDNEIKQFTGNNARYFFQTRQGEAASKYHPKNHLYNFMRLHNCKPSNTITKMMNPSLCGLAHPTENRFLTISELKRISTFPDDFKFTGKFEDKWARIGNAVMPNQMKAIAETIKEKILS